MKSELQPTNGRRFQSPLVIGTRGSRLALWQARYVAGRLSKRGIPTRLEVIRTKGDLDQTTPLPKIGDKGLFTAELDAALVEGRIDVAVHSLKDLSTELPPELTLAAVPERGSPYDALVSAAGALRSLSELPAGARIGSSSLRRTAQLLARRPDLTMDALRGNVETRLRKLDEGAYDAIILAEAGLERLGFADRISYRFDLHELMPAVGQGALGIVCSSARADTAGLLRETLNDSATENAVTAERAFLRALEGGCQVPVGGHAEIRRDGMLQLRGVVASLDGSVIHADAIESGLENPAATGRRLAERLLEMGADEILSSIRPVDTSC